MKTSLGQKTKSTNVQICNNILVQQSCVFIAFVEISKRIARRVEACAQQRETAMKMWQKESRACVGQHLVPESATPPMSGPVFYVRGAAGAATRLHMLPHTNVHSYATQIAHYNCAIVSRDPRSALTLTFILTCQTYDEIFCAVRLCVPDPYLGGDYVSPAPGRGGASTVCGALAQRNMHECAEPVHLHTWCQRCRNYVGHGCVFLFGSQS